jgi:hypothetical protein
MVWGDDRVQLYGTYKQAKKGEELWNFCPQTFERITGLDVGEEIMHIRATFEIDKDDNSG